MSSGAGKPEADYESLRAAFRLSDVLDRLGWPPDGPVNVAATLADRHAGDRRLALDWHGREGERRRLTFDDLTTESSRLAEVLSGLGVAPGDRVGVIMPRVPETVVAMLGIWKAGAVYLPIFSAFGADAIRMRLADSGAKVLIVHAEYRAALGVSDVQVIVVGMAGGTDDIVFEDAMAAASGRFEPVPVARRAAAALLYTSGSTGPPKGVVISVNFVAAVEPDGWHCGDLRGDDVFWPTGDPAWGYGLVCYALALARGMPVVMWRAQPDAEAALAFMAGNGVTNLATVPTLLRGIMALGRARVVAAAAPIRRVWC